MTDLRVAPCSHAAAKLAVERWHYSRTMPVGKLARFGIWEHDEFVGVVLFCWGANHNLSSQFGLAMVECVELVRVAMRAHTSPVSQVITKAVAMLRRSSPGLRLVVSFADPHEGHHGGIYQAGNWIYLGQTGSKRELELNGRTLNRRAYTGANFGTPKMAIPSGAVWVQRPGKHRYVMPHERAMRRQVTKLAQPYPQSADQVSMGDVQPTGRKGQVRSLRSAPLAEASA